MVRPALAALCRVLTQLPTTRAAQLERQYLTFPPVSGRSFECVFRFRSISAFSASIPSTPRATSAAPTHPVPTGGHMPPAALTGSEQRTQSSAGLLKTMLISRMILEKKRCDSRWSEGSLYLSVSFDGSKRLQPSLGRLPPPILSYSIVHVRKIKRRAVQAQLYRKVPCTSTGTRVPCTVHY